HLHDTAEARSETARHRRLEREPARNRRRAAELRHRLHHRFGSTAVNCGGTVGSESLLEQLGDEAMVPLRAVVGRYANRQSVVAEIIEAGEILPTPSAIKQCQTFGSCLDISRRMT